MKKLLNKYIPRLYGAYFNTFALFSKKKAAEKAFRLFCTPRKGRVSPNQVGFLKNAEHSVEAINGHQVQTYRWAGTGATILLLHGWESNTFRWRILVEFLQQHNYNLVAFDAPAHGKSSGTEFNVPLYTECVEHMMKLHAVNHIIAHSIGGMAALYHQYKNQNSSVSKIVTIGSPSELKEIMRHYERTLNYNQSVKLALASYFENRFGFAIKDFSTTQFVKFIKTKGLLIHDELDRISPIISSERVHAEWKNSSLIKTKGLGHSMHQPEVNDFILDFLNS